LPINDSSTGICCLQAARNSVARESAALQEQRAAIQSLLAQLEQREESLGQVSTACLALVLNVRSDEASTC
jgi:hypothetical protein